MTLTQAPEAPSHQTRRRSRVPLVLMKIAAVAVMLAAGAAVYVGQYEPLEQGQGLNIYGPDLTEVGPPWAKEDFVSLLLADGDEFGFLVDVRNKGPLGVTITAVGPAFFHPHATEMRLEIEPQARSRHGWDGRTVGFAPFRLGSGEQRAVKILFRFQQCPDFQSIDHRWDAMDSVRISYRTLGVTQEQIVRLPFTLGYALHAERCEYGD